MSSPSNSPPSSPNGNCSDISSNDSNVSGRMESISTVPKTPNRPSVHAPPQTPSNSSDIHGGNVTVFSEWTSTPVMSNNANQNYFVESHKTVSAPNQFDRNVSRNLVPRSVARGATWNIDSPVKKERAKDGRQEGGERNRSRQGDSGQEMEVKVGSGDTLDAVTSLDSTSQGEREEPGLLHRPIEWTPSRKFFSFQGAAQYEKKSVLVRHVPTATAESRMSSSTLIKSGDANSNARRCKLEPLQTTRKSVVLISTEGRGPGCVLSDVNYPDVPSTSPRQQNPGTHEHSKKKQQYEPSGARKAHGVREMADTKELDAIFKVSSRTLSTSKEVKIVSPMSVEEDIWSDGARRMKNISVRQMDSSRADLKDQEEHEEDACVILDQPTNRIYRKEQDCDVRDLVPNDAHYDSTLIKDSVPDNRNSYHHDVSREQLLYQTIPLNDKQWSIPSIRLANHVDTSGMDSSSMCSYHSTTFSDDEYTEEEYYFTKGAGEATSCDSSSYVEDDDVSWTSKESYDQVMRWRKLSGVLRRNSGSLISAGNGLPEHLSNKNDDFLFPPPVTPLGNSNRGTSMFDEAERVDVFSSEEGYEKQDVSFTNDPAPTTHTLSSTFNLEQKLGCISITDHNPNQQSIAAIEEADDHAGMMLHGANLTHVINSPALSAHVVNVQTHRDGTIQNSDMFRTKYRSPKGRHDLHFRRHRKKGRTNTASTSAVEWLHDLKSQNTVSTNGGEALIAEAASSRFLTGAIEASKRLPYSHGSDEEVDHGKEDTVTKVLGMPHPLCRSSTIEVAQFEHLEHYRSR